MSAGHPHRFDCPIATAVPGLALRPLAAKEAPAIDVMAQEPSIAAWWRAELETEDTFEDYLDDEGLSPFAVIWQTAIVGYAQIYHANSDPFWSRFGVPRETYGLDMFLSTAVQGRGLGVAVTNALIDTICALPGIARIHIDPDPENARAIATYGKAGFIADDIYPGYGPGSRMLYMTLQPSALTHTGNRQEA